MSTGEPAPTRGAAEVRASTAPTADLAGQRPALEDWLRRALTARSLTITAIDTPAMNGASNETVLIDTEWVSAGGVAHRDGFVLRRPSKGWPLFHRWAAEGEPQPILDATLAWLHEHRPTDPPPEGLNWGDARIGNMLYEGFRPVGVLDWEMAGIGPGEVDLGWWLFMNRYHSVGMGHPPLPGFPDDATTIAMYAEALGRPARDVHYYDVFGGFRFAIVVVRAARGLMHDGRMPADSTYAQDNGATRLLAEMIA